MTDLQGPDPEMISDLRNCNRDQTADIIVELYKTLDTHPEYAADTTFAAIWQWLDRKDKALALARGEASND